MRKIHIFTVYNSRNFGSYLQATALLNALKKYGQVDFVDTKTRSTDTYKNKEILRNFLRLQFKRALFEHRTSEAFLRQQGQLPVVEINDIHKNDICFFGSDEIWNVARKAFSDYPIFWGEGFRENAKISYAPSINYATEQQLRAYGAQEYLKRFAGLSVRDDYSKKTLESVTGLNFEKVLDPTMLFTKEHYLRDCTRQKIPFNGYIAVYCYFRRNDKEVKQIKQLARKLGKKLVSVGLYNSWCDYCVANQSLNPFVYYEDADYVISNTFHGIAFAITFQKDFIAVLRSGSNKVQSMLEDMGLSSRIVDGNDSDIMLEILKKPINYPRVSSELEYRRKKSFDFIGNALGGITDQL